MSKSPHDIVTSDSQAIQERITTLLAFASIEMIFCYGMRREQNDVWTLFKGDPQISESIDMDVLIVIHPSEKHREHELVDRVNRLNNEEVRLISVIHNSDAVNESIAAGSLFFQSVLRKGVPIYQRSRFSFPDVLATSRNDAISSKHWTHHSALADKFLSGAEFYITKGQADLAAFMLHQSSENILSAIIFQSLGYRATTHNLNRLLSLTENFSGDISNVFPRGTEADNEVFSLLSHAYSQVRYNDSFNISKDQSKVLFSKVAVLISIITRVHQADSMLRTQKEHRFNDVLLFDSIGIDTYHNIVLHVGEHVDIRFESLATAQTVKTDVDGTRLWISHVSSERQEANEPSIIHVTCKKLTGLVVNHAGSVTMEEVIKGDWFGVINNSNSNVKVSIDATTVDATATKRGNIVLEGRTHEIKILNTGLGIVDALKLKASEAKVVIKKAGVVKVHVTDYLETNLSDFGQLVIQGNPEHVKSGD
ncbi:MAG TPA: DUF2807 domain-containing protein [Cyclobacteriaceae bacterium]|nr:DUF2807 domain-containing protein [Cyclobacteriaceae bacterium]